MNTNREKIISDCDEINKILDEINELYLNKKYVSLSDYIHDCTLVVDYMKNMYDLIADIQNQTSNESIIELACMLEISYDEANIDKIRNITSIMKNVI